MTEVSENEKENSKKILSLILGIVEKIDIFPDSKYNPVVYARSYPKNDMSIDSIKDYWWQIIEECGIRDFSDREVLIARISLCLLDAVEFNEAKGSLGDYIRWLTIFIGKLGYDVNYIDEVTKSYFD